MFRSHTEAFADLTDLIVGRGRLASGHGRDVVVENHHHHIGFLVDTVEQACHAAMAEGTVADDRHGREDAHFAGTLGHGDGGAHAHGGLDGAHVEAQGIAADVTKYLASLMVGHHSVEGRVTVDVRATLAERGRAVGDHFGHRKAGIGLHAEGLGHFLGIQLAIATDGLVQASHDLLAFAEETFDLLFHERLAVFKHQDLIHLVIQLVDHVVRQRILGYLDHRVGALATGEVFHQVIVGDTRGDDAELLVRTIHVLVIA